MKITIFSLGGLLGQYVTNTALLHGAQVTAYVPDAKAIWPRKNLTVIEGSLQNRERVLEALLEADAVISVLTPMRVKHVKEEETPLADGNAMILSAMKQLGKTRFVTVGHVCIHAFGDCEDKYQRMSTKFMQIFWPGVYKDMQKMGQVLARSDLNWTLVRTCQGRDGKVKKVGQNCSISQAGSIPQDWCKGYEDGAVAITDLGPEVADGTAEKVAEVEAALKDGSLHVFDTSKFTVDGAEVTTAPIDLTYYDFSTGSPVAVYQGKTKEAVSDGYFHEGELRAAPTFALRIDGIIEDADPVA